MVNKVLFRLNAGKKYGLGHLSRNLTLAEVFSKDNMECQFLIKTDDEERVTSFLKTSNTGFFQTTFIEETIDCKNDLKNVIIHCNNAANFLILDHYDHNYYYQLKLKEAGIHWAQFDYKKEDPIIADIVINPNVGVKVDDYVGLIGSKTKGCLGEKFAIINSKFNDNKVKPQPDRILIAMGGGRYPKEVVEMIDYLVSYTNYKFDIICSENSLQKRWKNYTNIEIHNNPRNVADIYARNNVAFVAGGVTTYELAYLGIPMIVIPYALNQLHNAETWENLNYAIKFSTSKELIAIIQTKGLQNILLQLDTTFKKREEIIDGYGANRILETIKSL